MGASTATASPARTSSATAPPTPRTRRQMGAQTAEGQAHRHGAATAPPCKPAAREPAPSWNRLCRFTAPDRIVGARPAGAVGVQARSRRLPDNCAGAAASRAGSRSGVAGHGQTTCRPGETGRRPGEDFSPRRERSLSVRPPCGERPRRPGALTHRPGGLP